MPYNGDLSSRFWRAKLDSLKPETDYLFRIGNNQEWTEWQHFRTPAKAFKPFSILYFGDAQNDIKTDVAPLFNQAFQHIANAQKVIHEGDMIDRSTHAAEAWHDWLNALGAVASSINQFVTPGNHEYDINSLTQVTSLKPEFNALFAVERPPASQLSSSVFSIIFSGGAIYFA